MSPEAISRSSHPNTKARGEKPVLPGRLFLAIEACRQMSDICVYPTGDVSKITASMMSPNTPPCRSTIPFCQGASKDIILKAVPRCRAHSENSAKPSLPWSATILIGAPAHEIQNCLKASASTFGDLLSRHKPRLKPVARSKMLKR